VYNAQKGIAVQRAVHKKINIHSAGMPSGIAYLNLLLNNENDKKE
jgi:hypothetical protein